MNPVEPSDTSLRRPPRRRWLRRLAAAGGGVVAAALLAHFFVLPWVVRSKVQAAFEGLGLEGARFDVRSASPWGTTIRHITAANGTVRIESIEVSYRPLAVLSGELDRITLRGAEARVGVRNGKPQWPVNVRLASNSTTGFRLPFQAMEVTSASAVVIDWDGQVLRLPLSGVIESKGAGTASARASIAVQSPSGELTLPGAAKLRGPAGVLLVDGTFDVNVRPATDGATAWRVSAEIHGNGNTMLSAPGYDVNPGRVRVIGTVSGLSGDPAARVDPVVEAEVTVDHAALHHAASDLTLAEISLHMPVSMNTPPLSTTLPSHREPGSFSIPSVTFGGRKMNPASGTIAVRDGRAEFSAGWAALPDSMLSANGRLSYGDGGVKGEVNASIPEFQLADATALAVRLPALKGWNVTGRLGADAKLAIEASRPRGRVTITAAEADAASKDAGIELHGVGGTVALDLAGSAVTTPPSQRVTASRAAVGSVEMSDLSLDFTLEKPDALLLQRLSAGWLGGRVSTAGVRINPSQPKFEATLVAQRLSLRELLAFAAEGRARGEGVMSGRLPVKVDWPRVTLGAGFLKSDSPTGELQVLDTQWLGETMDQSDPRFRPGGELGQVKQRIVAALTDFTYDRLTFQLAEEPASHGLLKVNAHGKGRVGERPQELELTLNIRGVDDLLKYALQVRRKYEELTNPKK